MALVDLKTDLKSLKFESGLNRKPFVVKDIDRDGGRNSGLAVQGILASKRIDDVVRMAKLVIAKPGITHAVKQALSGFISAVDKKATYEGAAGIGKELVEEAKDIVLSALTNVGQTPLNGLGLHLFKGKLQFDPTSRDYQRKIDSTARNRTATVSHSLGGASQGISKAKKLKIADKPDFGRIDYLTPPGADKDTVTGRNITEKKDINTPAADIIPFYFNVLNEEEDKPTFIQFRAFLTSLSDTFTGQWNKTQYLGRPEQFKTYNGFERNIAFGFKVAAEARKDLVPLYQKLNYLASTTAPTFSKDGIFMRGTLVKTTIGDYLSDQLMNITSVTLNWDINYPWEVKLQPDKETDVQILPHVLDVSISAEAIHEFVPERGKKLYFTNRYKDQIF